MVLNYILDGSPWNVITVWRKPVADSGEGPGGLAPPPLFLDQTETHERAPMGSELGLMGYWLRGHEGERNNCFSKIQLVGKKYQDKTTLAR